jgi:hypothetical protein
VEVGELANRRISYAVTAGADRLSVTLDVSDGAESPGWWVSE